MENLTMNTALFSSFSLSLAFALFGMAKTANAQTSEQLEEDTKKLVTMYIHLSDEWSGKYDRRGLKIDDYMKLLKEVQSINDMAVVPAEKALADFKKKYGKYGVDGNAFRKFHEELVSAEKKENTYPNHSAYEELSNEIKNFKEETIAKGDIIAMEAENYYFTMIDYREDPKEVADFIRDARTMFNIALLFSPNSTQAKESLKKLEAIGKEKLKLIEESRKSARMPAQSPDFTGNAADVVKQALAYINSKPQDGKQKYFTGSIASGWYARKDAFGNIIDYTIQINIGYQMTGDQPANLVHVYQAILYTCGPKASPPFCKSGSVAGWEFAMFKENLGK
jgi:hypothetical protein